MKRLLYTKASADKLVSKSVEAALVKYSSEIQAVLVKASIQKFDAAADKYEKLVLSTLQQRIKEERAEAAHELAVKIIALKNHWLSKANGGMSSTVYQTYHACAEDLRKIINE